MMLNGNGSVDTQTRLRAQQRPPTPREQVAARVIAVIEHRGGEIRVTEPERESETPTTSGG